MHIIETIAKSLHIQPRQVQAVVALMDEGATVPFIARYRKEATGNLDDVQLRALEKLLGQQREWMARQQSIMRSIEKQGLLNEQLKKKLLAATTLTQLEDLYLPYKSKRTSKALIAKEAGLWPLAQQLLTPQPHTPETLALAFVDEAKGIVDVQNALLGAQEILIEQFSEDAALLATLRRDLKTTAVMRSQVVKKKQQEAEKFTDYFSYVEALKSIPSHRALALFRGQNEGFLRLKLEENMDADASAFLATITRHFQLHDAKAATYSWLQQTIVLTWQKLRKRFETELFQALRSQAEDEAVLVFGENLRDLLLAAPAGQRATLGLDPGIRTGVKVAVVDQHGKLLETAVIYPHPPHNRWQESIAALVVLADKHKFELVAIGNGTGSRETEKLVADLKEQYPQLPITPVVVSEAGASVYSASELASQEFPNVDVTLRGAVSIARRLQDPLAELVKIQPNAIGVGQYQHDVNQAHLNDALHSVVEDCVNSVGVDINSASVQLLTYVAGLNQKVAASIVEQRNQIGAFSNRNQLQNVKGVGPKSFEQAAGFLRIRNGDNPLDASAVHPESYALVEKILAAKALKIGEVLGKAGVLSDIQEKEFLTDQIGEQTIRDVLNELEKPGRDPRPTFRTAKFKSGVKEIHDLREGMVLEGVVSNVTNFGAFVDIGVHQDGLVHISALANAFVGDPRKVVKIGQVVTVKVLEADTKRKRISLTMRLDDAHVATTENKPRQSEKSKKQVRKAADSQPPREKTAKEQVLKKLTQKNNRPNVKTQPQSALAAAFAKALQK